ncbi:MAG: hypothetical protein LKM35_00920 [Lachnospiraceae bacterium]|jgi:Fe2+ or Zn2+ uptake regulation protein|nr:hypothetical protein [Lachnospiraceae bacterium]
MAKIKVIEDVNKKGRLVYMYRLLYEQTDETHPLTTRQIIEWFAKRGVEVNRKTVKNDVETLVAAGYSIKSKRSAGSHFYMTEREFDFSELKTIIDAVNSDKTIPQEKCRKIVRKLTRLASVYEASSLLEPLETAVGEETR